MSDTPDGKPTDPRDLDLILYLHFHCCVFCKRKLDRSKFGSIGTLDLHKAGGWDVFLMPDSGEWLPECGPCHFQRGSNGYGDFVVWRAMGGRKDGKIEL